MANNGLLRTSGSKPNLNGGHWG